MRLVFDQISVQPVSESSGGFREKYFYSFIHVTNHLKSRLKFQRSCVKAESPVFKVNRIF